MVLEHAGRRLSSDSKSINPQWKVTRPFSFSEVQKYTDNFSQANDIGSGGYGKVISFSTLQCVLLVCLVNVNSKGVNYTKFS